MNFLTYDERKLYELYIVWQNVLNIYIYMSQRASSDVIETGFLNALYMHVTSQLG